MKVNEFTWNSLVNSLSIMLFTLTEKSKYQFDFLEIKMLIASITGIREDLVGLQTWELKVSVAINLKYLSFQR